MLNCNVKLGDYVSPECNEINLVVDGTILSASIVLEKNWNSAPEGYDVDNDVFNW